MLKQEQIATIPETVQNIGMIPLAQWNKYFAYPSSGTLRQMIFHNKYGINKIVTKLGGRIYIKVADFFNWLNEQDQQEVV